MSRGVVLLSAGLDSTAALALYLEQGGAVLRALTMDYGQWAAPEEVARAKRIAEHYHIPHEVWELPWFREFDSGLTQKRVPTLSRADLLDDKKTEKSAEQVWVPNRNGVFVELAAAFAESIQASDVLVGFNREEAAHFPDNTREYRQALTSALQFSTRNGVRVVSPTEEMDKVEIVAHAKRLKVPLNLVWSCYKGGRRMCGLCESCARLRRALERNEVFLDVFERSVV